MHSSTFDKENLLKTRQLCVKSHLAPTDFQETYRLQSDTAKDRDAGIYTDTTADVAPGLKSHSSAYPKFASAPLLLCVTHIESC